MAAEGSHTLAPIDHLGRAVAAHTGIVEGAYTISLSPEAPGGLTATLPAPPPSRRRPTRRKRSTSV